jgi:anti-sigma factor RsiW
MTAHLGDVLSGLLDGELTPSAEASARQHLDACASELDDVRTARSWLRALPPVEPPAGFYENLLRDEAPEVRAAAAVRAPSLMRPSARRKVLAVAGSAAAAVVLVTVAAPRQAPVSPSVNRMVEAHATGASLSSDPLSRLAPLGVPVSFRR